MAEVNDAFAVLGLTSDATTADVRAARRELAKVHHPDQGGDPAVMRAVNEAADRALAIVGRPADDPTDDRTGASRPGPDAPVYRSDREPSGFASDVPSFTVEALPVETFEGLLIVASWLGEVLDDDPPYRLDTHLHEPVECWCRLDVVPDAGASTVSLTIAGVDGARTPDIIAVRDLWITNLNAVDWS